MSERDTIDYSASSPLTEESILEDLCALGIERGDTLIVHSSLSSLGWVSGGAVAMIQSLQRSVGTRGTLVMPAHSGDLSDPAQWENPPVPEAWWKVIRESMPAYDRHRTPTRAMGIVPELFRTWPGVLRSGHPELSFSALGKRKHRVVRDPMRGSGFDNPLGDRSPVGALYELGGKILLLGVGYDSCTCLHLAEYRANWNGKKASLHGAPVMRGGKRVWVEFEDIEYDTVDFPAIGRAFEASLGARIGKVGKAEAHLLDVRELVDFAVSWMEEHRR